VFKRDTNSIIEMVEIIDAKISEPETFNPEMSELFGKVNG
jgi:hypothetical protein